MSQSSFLVRVYNMPFPRTQKRNLSDSSKTKVCLNIDSDTVKKVDQLAKQVGMSRSFIFSEAISSFMNMVETERIKQVK